MNLLDIYTISRNYSTIVATLPEPTVRPPSRLRVILFYMLSLVFYVFLCLKTRFYAIIISHFQNFPYQIRTTYLALVICRFMIYYHVRWERLPLEKGGDAYAVRYI